MIPVVSVAVVDWSSRIYAALPVLDESGRPVDSVHAPGSDRRSGIDPGSGFDYIHDIDRGAGIERGPGIGDNDGMALTSCVCSLHLQGLEYTAPPAPVARTEGLVLYNTPRLVVVVVI